MPIIMIYDISNAYNSVTTPSLEELLLYPSSSTNKISNQNIEMYHHEYIFKTYLYGFNG